MNYSTGIMLGNDKHMCEEYAVQQEEHTGAGGVFKIQNCSVHLPQNCFQTDCNQAWLTGRQTSISCGGFRGDGDVGWMLPVKTD